MNSKTIQIRIESLGAKGTGIGRLNGKVCLVPRTAPGDLVCVRIVQKTKGYLRGVVEEVLEPGPGRREPVCPLLDRCGGCGLMHLEEPLQRQVKQEVLARALGLPQIELRCGTVVLGYRRLARLHYRPRPMTLGFVGEQGSEVVDIPACPILSDKLFAVLPLLVPELLHTLGQPTEVRISEGQEGVALAVVCENPLPPAFYQAARSCVPRLLATVVATVGGHTAVVTGPGSIRAAAADGELIKLPAGGFGQANQEVNRLLGAAVAELTAGLGTKSCLELFSGAGNLTPVLARGSRKLDIVELDPGAVAAAKTNLAERGLLHVGVHQSDAFAGYHRLAKGRDLVVLDPPRTGSIEVCQALPSGQHRHVLYISCDPATLGRDLGPLRHAGYRIAAAMGFDMFPQTPHLEAAVLLER